MAIIKCDYCGKEFNKPPSRISKNNFCCREHYLLFHSKDVPICTCEICGKEFKGDKYNANRFCSRACYDIFHGIKNKQRECPTCHKIFEAKASDDIYCSWECYNKDRHMPKGEEHWNWQGGKSLINDRHDSTEYKKWRLAVYQRDNYKCQYCGSKEKINAHHIYSYQHYPELRYRIDNGITLCEKCHIKTHQKFGYDSQFRMILPKAVKKD